MSGDGEQGEINAGCDACEKDHEYKGSQAVALVLGRRVGMNGYHRDDEERGHQNNEQRHDGEVRIADWIRGGLDREIAET